MDKIYHRDLFDLANKIYLTNKEYDVKLSKFSIRYISDETKYLNVSDNYYLIYYLKDDALEPLIELRERDRFSYIEEKDGKYSTIVEFFIELKSYERKNKISKLLCGKK